MNNEILKFEDHTTLQGNEQKEEEEVLMLMIEKHLTYIKYSKIISLVMFLMILISFTVNISLKNGRSWYYVLAPTLIFVISTTFLVNFYLNIQNIIDNFESNEVNIGTKISYFCLNTISINLIIYLVMLCLKMEGVMNSSFVMISIPIYIIFGVAIFYFIFILPALIQTELYFEIILIFSYLLNLFIFLLIMNSKYDNNTNSSLIINFIPIWVALSLHLAYISYCVTFKDEQFVNYISSYLILAIIITVTTLISLKKENNLKLDNWVIGVLVIVAYYFFVIEKIYQFYWKKELDINPKNDMNK